jgi:Ser/Thr protein kinase RdoA (MazF antagonist)
VDSTASAAVRAAVAVAGRLGVRCADPAVLADGANVIVHLKPAPVVAKVAASTPVVRADGADWLQRELDVVSFLAGVGVPVAEPSPQVPAVVQRGDGHVMSFWKYLEPSGGERADEETIGSMLRELHAALRSYRAEPPVLAPLRDIAVFLARPQALLEPADVAAVGEAFEKLTAQLGAAYSDGAQVLHGDAGAGNLMASGGRWVWHDFEDTCRGPVAWDLAASTASQFRDGARVLAAYGEPFDADLLRVCEQLRRLHLTVWYAIYAERLPECRSRAIELLASWRS